MLIYAAYLLIWPLTVSPILTVLIYHFRMHRALADVELPGGGTHRRPVLYDVEGHLAGPLLNIPFQLSTTPLSPHDGAARRCCYRYMRRGGET